MFKTHNTKRKARNVSGFTLIELITVIIIIGILAALALPQYMMVMEKARGAEGKGAVGHIRQIAIAAFQTSGTLLSAVGVADQTGFPTSATSDNACASTASFFEYYIDSASSAAYTIRANRCEGNTGKPPSTATGSNYFIQDVVNLATSAVTSTASSVYQ